MIPLVVRFVAKVDRLYGDPPPHAPELGPCWPWMGAQNGDGYGMIRAERQADGSHPILYAHRVALALALGRPIREGYFANHRCDVPRCVRPAHLYEGSPTENVADMIERGRYRGIAPIHAKAEFAA